MDEHLDQLLVRDLNPGLSKRTDQFFRDRASLAKIKATATVDGKVIITGAFIDDDDLVKDKSYKTKNACPTTAKALERRRCKKR